PNAENYVNDASVEQAWLYKACRHASTHWNLLRLMSADPAKLRLTPQDDAIYAEFRARFPCLAVGKLVESELKSEDSKSAWRQFCQLFEDTVGEYNFGTLLRLDSAGDYSEANTTLVPRIQFLAVEVARNREGFNRGLDSLVPSQSALGAEPGDVKNWD
ncbi:hypothetical protein BOX15_Mlig003719g1, partial [Macrostomum lignano]